MRRGHNGLGGWRNENPREFRPRSGGNSHYRSSRNYGFPDSPRFPPLNSRSTRSHYHSHPDKYEQSSLEHSNRSRYRHNRYGGYHRPHQRNDRQFIPLHPQMKNNDRHNLTFKESTAFSKDVRVDSFHVNSMGDVDHRHVPQVPGKESYLPPVINPWMTDNNIQQPGDGFYNKSQSTESSDVNKFSADYTGHRPPASDQFACNPTHSFSAIDNSHSFSRSVDDTVDLIRKRLQNRIEPQQPVGDFNTTQNNNKDMDQRLAAKPNDVTTNQPETPVKKRYSKQNIHSIEKSNCAKIKNKIVHQLFKMDKDKIHKLMDNPNSSSKFEYAINSLIMESQNSFNRHLRSAAEKSLCSSSVEFMENDNNTIYEDTFLKQMQCILDPQDTIFLEDIKPIVMAELSKVLQIEDYEQKFDIVDDDNLYPQQKELHNYNKYPYDDYSTRPHNNSYKKTQNQNYETDVNNIGDYEAYEDSSVSYKDSHPHFDNRTRRKSYSFNEEPPTTSEISLFHQTPTKVTDIRGRPESIPFFDTNDPLSEDEDPFAELDNQYHVAVDHDFIEQDDLSLPKQLNESQSNNVKEERKSPDKSTKSTPTSNKLSKMPIIDEANKNQFKMDDNLQLKKEFTINSLLTAVNNILTEEKLPVSCTSDTNNEKFNSEANEMTKENKVIDQSAPVMKSATESSRKRSTDQRPSHRKEKRKKSESNHPEPMNQIINKNVVNINDHDSKVAEKSASVFNLLSSKEGIKTNSKENKKNGSTDKNLTEKHVKRKETPKKTSGKDRKDSTSSQPTSPNEKNEAKNTLKTIDMFTGQPKKVNIHQAHRNTAQAPVVTPKTVIENVSKTKGPISRQITKRHIGVQVLRKVHSKEIQTDTKKFAVKAVQTDIIPERSGIKAIDAFERMKEIDMEIQVLLQEKFKLYSSIDNKDSVPNSMQNLGMTVLNVEQFEGEDSRSTEDSYQEDSIVDDFTSIPVEELEQIALESVQEQVNQTPKIEKRNRRCKISYQDSVQPKSPTVGRSKSRKVKSPNISLIEQIITDDRPLEDIISLDDLEVPETSRGKTPRARQTARRRGGSRIRSAKSSATNIDLKQCSVVLIRTDLSDYLQHQQSEPETIRPIIQVAEDTDSAELMQFDHNIVVESIDNDIQFDMLDVSEDIVVGDSCEVKSLEDKEIGENVPVPISEEIILDNSQSSMEEEATASVCQGGECKMYDYSADENLRRDSVTVTGNADAVLALECVENNFLAACLDGNVYYFSNEGQLITTLRGSNLAVTCLTIVKEKYGTTVYTGSLDSRIRYYDLETGLEKGLECNVLSPIQTMDKAWDTVFVGTRTGFVLQFECKNNMLIPVSSVKFSDQSILALRAMKEGPRKVLLVAARSENVTIKDAQTGLLLRSLEGPKMTVYTLLYEDGKVYCGTSSHQIHVFDYTSGSHVSSHEGGKGAVCLRATGGLLFAGCYDGCIYVYREGESQPLAQIRGPSLMLLSLAIVGTKIIAGYKDRSLYIWKIPLCILQEMIL